MSLVEIEKNCRETMQKCVAYLKEELRGVRTGRASPALVDHLKVDVPSYGGSMNLRDIATVSAPDPVTVLIKPFDAGTTKDIERAIQSSEIGITPVSDGKVIRLPIPPLSGERREQISQQIRKWGEAQKIAVRSVRRDSIKQVDVLCKAGDISEDESKSAKERLQKMTEEHEKELDGVLTAKTAEIKEA